MEKGKVIALVVIALAGAGSAYWFILGPGAKPFATAKVEFDNVVGSGRRLMALPTPDITTPYDHVFSPSHWALNVVYLHIRETSADNSFPDEDCLGGEDRCQTEIVYEAPTCCDDPDELTGCSWNGYHCCCAVDEDTEGERDCDCGGGETRTATEFFNLARPSSEVNAEINSQNLPIMSAPFQSGWEGKFRSVTLMYGSNERVQVDANGTLSDMHEYKTDDWSRETDFASPWTVEEGDEITVALAYDLESTVLAWDTEPVDAPDETATTCWDDTATGLYMCYYAPVIVPTATKS